jgi:hypothetical protein
LEDTLPEPRAAFESFTNFIEDHKTAIDSRMIAATRNAASKLAEVYYSTNKKENELLSQLNEKLEVLIK